MNPSTPDTPATDRCAPASPAEVATVLEESADHMLIHGRCRDSAFGDDGSLCVIAALAGGPLHFPRTPLAKYDAALTALAACVRQHGYLNGVVDWNWETEDDDEVRDTLLHVAKELRNTAVPS